MRRSRLLSAAAAVLIIPLLQVLPASSVGAAPSDASAPVNDTREATRKDFTLDGKPVQAPVKLHPQRQGQGPGRRRDPGRGHRAPVARPRRDQRHPLPQGLHPARSVGQKIEVWVANDTAFPAGDCRNQIADTTIVTDAQANELRRPVRQQHVPEGDGRLQHAAGPRRDQLPDPAGRQRQRWRLHRRRRQDGRADRQRPRRQLLRLRGQRRPTSPASSPRSSTTCSTATS